MSLPAKLVWKLVESEGPSPNGEVSGEIVAKVVRQLTDNRGMEFFHKVAATPITVKAIANHLGVRPHVVARDLVSGQGLLKYESHLPFEQVVRLCHYYSRPLPDPQPAIQRR